MMDQPSEAQEAANAAWVWRRKCQGDLVRAAGEEDSERIEWAFERWKRALKREEIAKAAAGPQVEF